MKHPFKTIAIIALLAPGIASHAFAQNSTQPAPQATPQASPQQTAKELTEQSISKFESGDAETGLDLANRAIALDPKNARAYNNRGRCRAATGDAAGALADYNKSMELDPKYSSPYTNRGLLKKDQGDVDGAIADYTKSIELNPTWFGNYVNRGEIRKKKYDWDGSIADFTKAIELKPNLHFYFSRATTRREKHDWAGAIADYTTAYQMDERYYDALHARAETYNSAGDPDKALADLDHIHAAVPGWYEDELFFYNNGVSWKLKKDWAKALTWFDKYVDSHPQDGFGYYQRSLVKKEKGDQAGADADLKRALELDPDVKHPKTYHPGY